jgi:hypothetical protein
MPSVVRLGSRDYDPSSGRWTTKDPILFSSAASNLYEGLNGDPINEVDPAGTSLESFGVGVAQGVGIAAGATALALAAVASLLTLAAPIATGLVVVGAVSTVASVADILLETLDPCGDKNRRDQELGNLLGGGGGIWVGSLRGVTAARERLPRVVWEEWPVQ